MYIGRVSAGMSDMSEMSDVSNLSDLSDRSCHRGQVVAGCVACPEVD